MGEANRKAAEPLDRFFQSATAVDNSIRLTAPSPDMEKTLKVVGVSAPAYARTLNDQLTLDQAQRQIGHAPTQRAADFPNEFAPGVLAWKWATACYSIEIKVRGGSVESMHRELTSCAAPNWSLRIVEDVGRTPDKYHFGAVAP
jgi:hypothetical protein